MLIVSFNNEKNFDKIQGYRILKKRYMKVKEEMVCNHCQRKLTMLRTGIILP